MKKPCCMGLQAKLLENFGKFAQTTKLNLTLNLWQAAFKYSSFVQ